MEHLILLLLLFLSVSLSLALARELALSIDRSIHPWAAFRCWLGKFVIFFFSIMTASMMSICKLVTLEHRQTRACCSSPSLCVQPPFATLHSNHLRSSCRISILGTTSLLPLTAVSKTRVSISMFGSRGEGRGGALACSCLASHPEQLKGAREEIKLIISKTYSNPILIRLGWHDAGTYDMSIEEWPKCGGANGSLRYSIELNHAANAGLHNALKLLEPVKEKFPNVSYADLFQLASATAIELAGGPKIPMKYGRVDTAGPEYCVKEGNLPDAGPPDPAEHLRKVFYRMGLTDKEIVALSGAHTLGRSRTDRSGWGKPETKYTKDGPGAPGGQSWTVQWLKFDNSYFKEIKEKRDADLLVLPTDAVLFEDASFKVYAEQYAENQKTFFNDYAEAHKKLSELGAKFDPPEGICIDEFPEGTVSDRFVGIHSSSK